MGLKEDFIKNIANAFKLPPYQTPCTGDYNQGRDCDCCALDHQQRYQLEDEFNNANWPFPIPKP
jgi:hypothetical protein